MNRARAGSGFDAAALRARIREALAEDHAGRDATVAALGIGESPVRATIVAGAPLVVAGIDVPAVVYAELDARVRVETCVRDGERADAGDALARVEGPAAAVLRGERTALNLLQRACGVATLTARFVERVAGCGVTVLDTRKTTPLWRDLEKYAVRCGGGANHRPDLEAMILVKENHVRALGGADALVAALRAIPAGGPAVEVEVDTLELLDRLLASGVRVDRVMLDNFAPGDVATALRRVEAHARRGGRRPEVEVSGGITLETIPDYAQPGVDFVSVGALTHSAPAASISLEVERP